MQKNEENQDKISINSDYAVGIRQFKRAVKDGTARSAIVAKDIDEALFSEVTALCRENGLPFEIVSSKIELGKRAQISIAASVVTELKEV